MSKSSLSHIDDAVKIALQRFFSEVTAPKFIIAVSGGVDSMCLLHSFRQLNIDGVVAHINYQKRGSASDKDAALVKKMSKEWGFDCELVKVDPTEAEDQNFQQWARQFRYRFFRDLVAKHDTNGIALAHHQDDQIETILQKLFRGAGMASWSGMDVWDGELFRPLLGISREQIEHYAEVNNIPYRTDASNLESDYARNFLRNEWLEKLSDFYPGWKSNVLRMGNEAQNYENALAWIADNIVDQQGINKKEFDKLPPGLQRALVLHQLKERQPGIQISQNSLNRVAELGELQTGKEIELTPQFSVLRDRNYYVITAEEKGSSFDPKTLSRSELEQSSIEFENIELKIEKYYDPDFGQSLYLDADKLSWPITLRRWTKGDRLQPFGMEGHQTVAEHLTNRKISAAQKREVLVIESFEETICALIFPPIKNQSPPGTISELVKCDNSTKYCLRIKY